MRNLVLSHQLLICKVRNCRDSCKTVVYLHQKKIFQKPSIINLANWSSTNNTYQHTYLSILKQIEEIHNHCQNQQKYIKGIKNNQVSLMKYKYLVSTNKYTCVSWSLCIPLVVLSIHLIYFSNRNAVDSQHCEELLYHCSKKRVVNTSQYRHHNKSDTKYSHTTTLSKSNSGLQANAFTKSGESQNIHYTMK